MKLTELIKKERSVLEFVRLRFQAGASPAAFAGHSIWGHLDFEKNKTLQFYSIDTRLRPEDIRYNATILALSDTYELERDGIEIIESPEKTSTHIDSHIVTERELDEISSIFGKNIIYDKHFKVRMEQFLTLIHCFAKSLESSTSKTRDAQFGAIYVYLTGVSFDGFVGTGS